VALTEESETAESIGRLVGRPVQDTRRKSCTRKSSTVDEERHSVLTPIRFILYISHVIIVIVECKDEPVRKV